MAEKKDFADMLDQKTRDHAADIADILSQSLANDESSDDLRSGLSTFQASIQQGIDSDDPDMMVVTFVRLMLDVLSAYGEDVTRSIAERSALDGGSIILLSRIRPDQLAGLRAVARMAGSYEQALSVIMDGFARKERS